MYVWARGRVTREVAENAVISIACGYSHLMVLTTRGLYGLGGNTYGQLGLACAEALALTAVPIEGAGAVSCSGHATLILTKEGVFACGHGAQRHLGRVTLSDIPSRVMICGPFALAICEGRRLAWAIYASTMVPNYEPQEVYWNSPCGHFDYPERTLRAMVYGAAGYNIPYLLQEHGEIYAMAIGVCGLVFATRMGAFVSVDGRTYPLRSL